MNRLFSLTLFFLVYCSAPRALLADSVYSEQPDRVVLKGVVDRPLMNQHNSAVLDLAMAKTRAKYGPYTLKTDKRPRSLKRVFKELSEPSSESSVNVYVTVTSKEREKKAHGIAIPVRMGLLNFRLIVAKRENLHRFKRVRTVEDLKPIPLGSVDYWSTTKILRENNFNLVSVLKSSAIYTMLEGDRFQYLLRGVSELYTESSVERFDNFEVESDLLIYMPLPYYVFVAPSEKRLIKRLEEGLEIAIKDGSFEHTLLKYYGEYIERSKLSSRKTFYLHNSEFEGNPILLRPELWYLPNEEFSEHLKENFYPSGSGTAKAVLEK